LEDHADLPSHILGSLKVAAPEDLHWSEETSLQQAVETLERNLLAKAQERHRNQAKIAEVLGVNQSTIARKLKRYGLS